MKTCEEYQLDIEMKRHGALDAAAAAEAERHVAGCAECRRELATAAELEAALRAPTPAQPPGYGQVARSLARDRLIFKHLPWIVIASFVMQGALLGVLIAPENPLRLWGIISAGGLLLAGAVALDARRRRRAIVEAVRLGVTAWAAHRRKQLDAELRDLKILNVLLPFVGAGMVLAAWFFDPARQGARVLFALVGASVIPFLFAVHSLYRPRLLRERAELGAES